MILAGDRPPFHFVNINASIIAKKNNLNREEKSMETITLNGKTYYSEPPTSQIDVATEIKIVVLQRGWVLIGRFERTGDQCKLHQASVIRVWGTTRGLGELAKDGPTSLTKLDKCYGLVEFEALTMVLSISADESKWANKI